MQWDDGLKGNALAIAASMAKRLRVMAGPGTGKTFAMKRRIIRLIEQENADPSKILAVTFTRTSANDLRKELKDLGIPKAEKIHAMTLHSFCFGLLNQKEVFEKLQRKPRPLKSFNKKGSPQFELNPLLADLDLIQDFGGKRDKFKKIKAFEAAWARTQEEKLWLTTEDDRAFRDSIQCWLKDHDSILIGELIPLALSYVQNNPSSDILKKFTHVVVDEYQDLNKAEQILLDLIGSNGGISVVGDIDQSIYSFRCAHPEGIADFSARHSDVDDQTLDECRRCAKSIVAIADSLIKHNHPSSVPVRLKALESGVEGVVKITQWTSADDEATGIAQLIKKMIESSQFKPNDILILSPRRLLGYKLRDLIQSNGISVHSFFHEEAVEDPAAQKAVTLLNLLVNPNDGISLRFWLGLGVNNCRSKQYKTVLDLAKKEGLSVRQILDNCTEGKNEIKGITTLKKMYSSLLNSLKSLADLPIDQLIDQLFPEGKEETKVLREASLIFFKGHPDADAAALWDHIETMLTQPEMPEEGDFVRIMSLHKSKGLTSRVTIITSCIEGLIPNIDETLSANDQKNSLMEQRRLFYVAITRAKELLILSSFNQVSIKTAHSIGAKFNRRGSYAETMATRFMDELGASKPMPLFGPRWQENGFEL